MLSATAPAPLPPASVYVVTDSRNIKDARNVYVDINGHKTPIPADNFIVTKSATASNHNNSKIQNMLALHPAIKLDEPHCHECSVPVPAVTHLNNDSTHQYLSAPMRADATPL
jgi:hypothetical protein